MKSLNAPFIANWNDYPVTEELIFAAMGWQGRGIGLFASANAILLLAHVLAGLSFLWVAKALKYKTAFSLPGPPFAFSPFIISRNLCHLTVAHYWHVPLFLLGNLVDLLRADHFMGPKMVGCGSRLLYYGNI